MTCQECGREESNDHSFFCSQFKIECPICHRPYKRIDNKYGYKIIYEPDCKCVDGAGFSLK